MNRGMKHSGIEWIGEIPKEWKVISFNNGVLRMSTGLNPRDNFELTKDDEYYYVTIKNFKDGKIYLDDNCDRISKKAWDIIQERSQLQKGDILFASISKDGQAYILEASPVNWNINESVFSIRTNHEYFYDKYFYYHIIDSEYYNDLRLDATGTTFQSIKQNKLRKSILCLPPLSEQQKIADYLDKVCGEVDDMIDLQEQMIEELKAYKQSVITEAVTKGLNPDVPMKDSGIDWIGEVPVHWEVKKIKYLSNVVRGGSPRPAGDTRYYEGDIPFMKVADITKDENIYVNSCEYTIKEAGLPHTRTVLPGTLLLTNSGATLGVPKINTFKTTFNDGIAAFLNIDKELNIIFAYYSLKARTKHFLESASLGIGQPNLNTDIIGNTPLLLPPLSEQQSIASYLDTKCSEIDALIAIKQQKIEELKEYKKSVIYEYVTGKKEVV